MIAFVRGQLVDINENDVIIDCGGIGYRILMPSFDIAKLPNVGEEVKVHTYFHVNDQGMSLFGLCSVRELDLFKMLISVNGLGPKGAISILGTLMYDEICTALITGDAKTIAKAPGVGKKIAERAIVDLRDKIDASQVVETKLENVKSNNPYIEEAILALQALGYSKQESKSVAESIDFSEDMTEEAFIKECLKRLAF